MTRAVRTQGRFLFNVWVGIMGGRIVGLCIYDGTLTAVKYLQTLNEFVVPFLAEVPLAYLRDTYFQQDGAPVHNYALAAGFLNQHFQK